MSTAKLVTGVELYYEIHGEGETVVLLQGTGRSCDVWKDHPVSDLEDQYRFVIFDPRGIGRSSRVDHFFSVYQLAADTAALLDHIGVNQAYVLGHSIGGRIALALSILYPGKVKSLFLAATGSGPAVRTGEGAIALPPLRLIEGFGTRGYQDYLRHELMETNEYFSEAFRKAHPEVVAAFCEMSQKHDADLRTYIRYVFARSTFEVTHQLGSIKLPVWIVVGGADVAGAGAHLPQSLALKERIPHAVLKMLPNKCHGFFWEDPSGTKDILLEWLTESVV